MRTFRSIIIAVALVITSLGSAKASEVCSVATLHGTYADNFWGLSTPTTQSPQPITSFSPFEGNGMSFYDGSGHTTAEGTASNGGLRAGHFKLKGTYRVNSDCTGSANYGPNNRFDFVILHGGQEINIMESDGTIAVWTSTRM
ncbi:MAG TPA: hypothetical protein VID24_04425 [Candidatus Eremiobacteraceae bacterium]|jgi:hypothetical protein